jgi:hypothetical protein
MFRSADINIYLSPVIRNSAGTKFAFVVRVHVSQEVPR